VRSVKDRSEAFQRFSRAVDGPMTVLALAMLPLIVVPLVVELSPGQARAVLAVDYLIWAACYAWRAWRGWSLLPWKACRRPARPCAGGA
jgi:hypothetical protein